MSDLIVVPQSKMVGYAAGPCRLDLLSVSDVMLTFYPTVGEAICAHFRGAVRK